MHTLAKYLLSNHKNINLGEVAQWDFSIELTAMRRKSNTNSPSTRSREIKLALADLSYGAQLQYELEGNYNILKHLTTYT